MNYKAKVIGFTSAAAFITTLGICGYYLLNTSDEHHDAYYRRLNDLIPESICDLLNGLWSLDNSYLPNCFIDASVCLEPVGNTTIAVGDSVWNATMIIAEDLSKHVGHAVFDSSATPSEQVSQVLTVLLNTLCHFLYGTTQQEQTGLMTLACVTTALSLGALFAAFRSLRQDQRDTNRQTWGSWLGEKVGSCCSFFSTSTSEATPLLANAAEQQAARDARSSTDPENFATPRGASPGA